MKLLIVDDEDIIREGIVEKIAWKENGFTLTTPGKNGLDAKEIIERERPDIVLTDINMPFINGLELAAWIREEYPDIKIIFLTGYDEFQYAKKAIQLKASAYILKYEKQEMQIPLHRITDSASNGSVFPVVTEHFSASSDHAFL